ncbi:MAG TPA: isocitrate lyase/phosphoenolpyruvate mutase family protein [Gemmatimonadales bacterium]|jgi:2-methylisocitrate lyase-like PEP mutase family enzyme
MSDQRVPADQFVALHQRAGAFVIPNPWDAGSARLLAHLGFEALATTSAGFAFSIGKQDTAVSRDEMLAHVAAIAAATPLPVSADLENGYADAPREVVTTYLRAAEAGAVGASIEDATNKPGDPIYDIELAADRVRAVAEAVHALPWPFTLTARAENHLHGRPDLADTIARLQAYQQAGADVLYAPGLITADDIAAVVHAVDRPVNVLAGVPGFTLDRATLDAIGVRRISIGSGLARAALGEFLRASREMRDRGTFSFMDDVVPFAEVMGMLKTPDR